LTTSSVLILGLLATLHTIKYPASIQQLAITVISYTLVHYLLLGILLSFIAKKLAEAKLIKNDGVNEPIGGHKIEPLYAFDIHCNSFFPVILFSYLIPVSISN